MWNKIETQDDIKALMSIYADFHDSCIVSINYTSGYYCDEFGHMHFGSTENHMIIMKVHSTWAEPIEMRFTGVRKCSIVGWRDFYNNEIHDASLSFHTKLLGKTRDDRLIVFADGSFNPELYNEESVISKNHYSPTYIIAEKMSWRFQNENNDK